MGALGAAAWLGWRFKDRPIDVVKASSATCVQTPQDTSGPYWVEEMLNRSDLRIDPTDNSVRDGLPLTLCIHVHQLSDTGCAPLANAQVDLWHCDAGGTYSDVAAQNTGGKIPPRLSHHRRQRGGAIHDYLSWVVRRPDSPHPRQDTGLLRIAAPLQLSSENMRIRLILLCATAFRVAGQTTINLSRDLIRFGIASQNLAPNTPTLDAQPLLLAPSGDCRLIERQQLRLRHLTGKLHRGQRFALACRNGRGSGADAGTVEYTIAPNNTATPRTGSIAVAGIAFTVTQSAPPAPTIATGGVLNAASFSKDSSGLGPMSRVSEAHGRKTAVR